MVTLRESIIQAMGSDTMTARAIAKEVRASVPRMTGDDYCLRVRVNEILLKMEKRGDAVRCGTTIEGPVKRPQNLWRLTGTHRHRKYSRMHKTTSYQFHNRTTI